MSSIDSVLNENKKNDNYFIFVQTILPLESSLMNGILPQLKSSPHLAYSMIEYFASHVFELSESDGEKAFRLIKWIPTQESISNKSLFIALIIICTCERLAIAKKQTFKLVSKKEFSTLKHLVNKLEAQIVIETFARIISLAYVFNDKQQIYNELNKLDIEFLDTLSTLKLKVMDGSDRSSMQFRYATLIVAFALSCLTDETIIKKCTTEITAESSMAEFAPGYVFLILIYYKASKQYKKNLNDNEANELLKLYRAIIKNVKFAIDRIE